LHQKKISFLTTGHDPLDDRIFYHMARSFSEHGWMVEIVSSKSDLKQTIDGITLNCFSDTGIKKREKILRLKDELSHFSPDIVICSEPLAVLAAKKYSKENRSTSIIYDITEWYPSKKNLEDTPFVSRGIMFLKLIAFNFLASFLADAFIFGEWHKSRPYRILFPFRPDVTIPYYPDRKYVFNLPPDLKAEKLRLCFFGRISLEKGFGNFINVVKRLSSDKKDLRIEVKIIGWYHNEKDKSECEDLISFPHRNIYFSFYEKQPYQDFIKLISDSDIFIDLRKKDFENDRCLPIRLFYFAALGRPVIITDLKSVRKVQCPGSFCFAVDPADDIKIAGIITDYLKNRELYLEHCREARKLFETKFNWAAIEPELMNFVNEISAG
jgi:glycosyltransferase involved in cell wall biosynthesis